MRKLEKREWFLLVLLGVAGAVALWWGRGGGFGGQSGPEVLKALDLGDPPHVVVDRLSVHPADYDPKARNLFAYYTPPPPTPQRSTAPVRQAPPPPPPPPPPPTTTAKVQPRDTKPKPPTPSFRYLGRLGPKDDLIAFFEDKDDILMARLGDTVQDDFKLVEFKFDSVVIGYTDQRFAGMTTELAQKSNR